MIKIKSANRYNEFRLKEYGGCGFHYTCDMQYINISHVNLSGGHHL